MVAAAASYYKATLNATTGLSAPLNNLAVIYKQQVVTARVSSLICNSYTATEMKFFPCFLLFLMRNFIRKTIEKRFNLAWIYIGIIQEKRITIKDSSY